MSNIYSVVHIKIPEEHLSTIRNDIVTKFNEISNKNELDMIEIHNFFTKPHSLIQYHRYIYIGNFIIIDTKLPDIFKNIEQSFSISTENGAILRYIYGDDFVNKINEICKISKDNNEILHFVPYMISNDDNINSIYDILSLSIPNLTNDKIHLFANRENVISDTFYFDIRHKIVQASTLFRDKTSNGKFNMDTLKFILWSFGVPYFTIERVISSKYNTLNIDEPTDILKILDDKLINEWIKIAYIYTCPTYNITQYNNELLYPILSTPFIYLDSLNNKHFATSILS